MILGYENLSVSKDLYTQTISIDYIAPWGDVYPYNTLPYPLQYSAYYDFNDLIEGQYASTVSNTTNPFALPVPITGVHLYPDSSKSSTNPFKRTYCQSIDYSPEPEMWLPYGANDIDEEANAGLKTEEKRKVCRIKCKFSTERPDYDYGIYRVNVDSGGFLTYKEQVNGCWFFNFDENGFPIFEKDPITGEWILIPDSANNGERDVKVPITNLQYSVKMMCPFYYDETTQEYKQYPTAMCFNPFLFTLRQGMINSVPFCFDLTGEKNYNYMYYLPVGSVLLDTARIAPTLNKNSLWEIDINLTFKVLPYDWNYEYHTAEQAKNPVDNSPLFYQNADPSNQLTYTIDKRFEGMPIMCGQRNYYTEAYTDINGNTVPEKLQTLGLPIRGKGGWGKILGVSLSPETINTFCYKYSDLIASGTFDGYSIEELTKRMKEDWDYVLGTQNLSTNKTDSIVVSDRITKYNYTDLNPLVGLLYPGYKNSTGEWVTNPETGKGNWVSSPTNWKNYL